MFLTKAPDEVILECCPEAVVKSLWENKLKLNPDRMEVMLTRMAGIAKTLV